LECGPTVDGVFSKDGDSVRFDALIDEHPVIRLVVKHLGLPTEACEVRPPCGPPVSRLCAAQPTTGAHDEFFVADPV
jgi:hypothetical protein